MIINKFNLKYGHLCLKTKIQIAPNKIRHFRNSCLRTISIQRHPKKTNCDVEIKYDGGYVIDFNIFNNNKYYNLYRSLSHSLSLSLNK